MIDWIKELCPEISDWQVELIDEEVQRAVAAEREACAKLCESAIQQCIDEYNDACQDCAIAIRARGQA